MKSKIAYLSSSISWGGLEMNQIRNAIWMKKKGYLVCIIGIDKSHLIEEAKKNQIETICIKKYRKYYDFINAFKLCSIIKKNRITHLIVRDTKDLSITATVKFILKNKIFTSYFMEMQLGISKKNLLHTIRFKGLDLWSCPLNCLSDQVKKMTRFQHTKIKVIGSGIDLSKCISKNKISSREILGLPKDSCIIGLPGRIDSQKGQLLLLNAFNELKTDNKHIVFMGNETLNETSEYNQLLHEYIKLHDLKKCVHFISHQKNMTHFYSAIDIMVMASKSETFGMVTLEALSFGIPVIGSNSGGTPELLGNGDFGYLFEPNNPKSLSIQMKYAFDNHKSLFSEKQLRDHLQKFDHHKVCKSIEKELSLNI
tara:strand:- start:170 stop:1273 length:1104 start_codon:yes stop_codon:yes gene_type:complete